MALSFKESLEKVLAETSPASAYSMRVMSLEDIGDSWNIDENYEYYDEYADENLSYIDELKNIKLDSKQINLTQETNSQYVPFEMPRRYDGFDLLNTKIYIHYVNNAGWDSRIKAINVRYTEDKIRFAWLIDTYATAVEGQINFEIEAIGVNSKGFEYVWKTKTCNQMNVLKSLSGDIILEPDESWKENFLYQINSQVAVAEAAAQEARNIVDNIPSEIEGDISVMVSEKMNNYYTKIESEDIFASEDEVGDFIPTTTVEDIESLF